MKLSAPKQITFWIAVIIAVVGLISGLVTVPVLSPSPSGLFSSASSFWLSETCWKTSKGNIGAKQSLLTGSAAGTVDPLHNPT